MTSSTPALIDQLDPARHAAVARDFLRHHSIAATRHPEVSTLNDVLQAFIQIPYENLSKILKYHRQHQDTLSLRFPEEVWHDFRTAGLGGTCFSLTFFLQAIVEALGFASYPVLARMKAGEDHHCALVVDLAGNHYLLDPGYVLDVPMQIGGESPRLFRSAHAGVELRPDPEAPLHYQLFTFQAQQQQWRYSFADIAATPERFLAAWLASFGWNGMNGLCLTRVRRDSLIFVHKHFMRETTVQGKQNYNLKRNREQVIHELFGIPGQIVEAAEAAVQERLAWRNQPNPSR